MQKYIDEFRDALQKPTPKDFSPPKGMNKDEGGKCAKRFFEWRFSSESSLARRSSPLAKRETETTDGFFR